MMWRLNRDQDQFFYAFNLDDAVPADHLVRKIAAVLDLSWVHQELACHYSHLGRPSIDPELMLRMLILGYIFGIRSERALVREVQVNLAYRWFCRLSIEDNVPDHSAFSRARNERFADGDVLKVSLSMRALLKQMPTGAARSEARIGPKTSIPRRRTAQPENIWPRLMRPPLARPARRRRNSFRLPIRQRNGPAPSATRRSSPMLTTI